MKFSRPALKNSGDWQAAARRLRQFSRLRPALAIVLGSGFKNVLSGLQEEQRIAYADIPGFSVPRAPGHAGEARFGTLGGVPILALNGRAHYYEGHSMDRVVLAVRALAGFGIRHLLLTNAAGGINPKFRPGDLMLVSDHINFMGVNPLRGETAGEAPPFVDLTAAYDAQLGRWLRRAARDSGVKLHSGVYLAVSGPSYETPAEIRAFATWGADAVGMSTVPEVIASRQCGLRVAAISCITNVAARKNGRPISHAEVLENGAQMNNLAAQMLNKFAKLYGSGS